MGSGSDVAAEDGSAPNRYPSRLRPVFAIAGALSAVLVVIALEASRTAPLRQSTQTFTALIAAANQQDLPAARRLCTARYLRTHDLRTAEEGGLVGLPRTISRNFQVWREGPNVRLCPTNRIGPVYQFVREGSEWHFDGPIGLLMPGGSVQPLDDAQDPIMVPQ
jgi:hypothetical protein